MGNGPDSIVRWIGESADAFRWSRRCDSVVTMSANHHPAVQNQIASLAHQFWESEGKPEGKSDEHWKRAEDHILETLGGPAAVELLPELKESSTGPGSDSLTL